MGEGRKLDSKRWKSRRLLGLGLGLENVLDDLGLLNEESTEDTGVVKGRGECIWSAPMFTLLAVSSSFIPFKLTPPKRRSILTILLPNILLRAVALIVPVRESHVVSQCKM